MNRFLLCGLLFFLTDFVFGQSSEKGYYITMNNDTIVAKFFVPDRAYVTYCLTADGIQILDSNKKKIWILPTEAKECRFTFKKKEYRIFSKPDNEYGRRVFLAAEVVGAKVSLFQCTAQGNVAFGRWNELYFLLEKANGQVMNTTTKELQSTLKGKLREFFKDDKSVLKLMEEKFNKKESVNEILKAMAVAYNEEKAE